MSSPQLPPGSGRRRRSWTLPLLLVLLIAVPMAEIWVLLQVGNWIGLLPTIGLLIVLAVLGTWLSRREGGKAWKGINEALRTGEFPSGRMADAAMVLVGALLLVFPGFLTDIVAMLFLLPFTRPMMRRVLGWSIARQARKFTPEPGMLPPFGMPGFPPRPVDEHPGPPPAQGDVIQGEVVEEPVADDDRDERR
ncbi:FxsA family protein [Granulicoccus sp. GXG6511]|uniref:FxsA family protein n=1 Tax=Granulicoccus sp. GXG6511 TaxID=3381351 RepID=UPI003D7EE0D1